jgi:hypothetical protein
VRVDVDCGAGADDAAAFEQAKARLMEILGTPSEH